MTKLSRRQLLRGVGGFTLALPFLPSLLRPGRASAAVPQTRRFVQFCTQHGGIWGANMFPADATLTEQMAYAGRTVKRGALALQTSNGTASLSRVLSAPSATFTPSLAAKMNVIRGVDIPFYIAHHTGGHLGNFARNDGNGSDGQYMQQFPTPTIDQVMAWSNSFYADLSTVRERVLVVGPRISYGWSNPQQRAGTVQEVAGSSDALELFKRIFVPNDDPNANLPPVVDRVLADYNRLRASNTRLSSDDRRRLDDHMQRLSELERRLKVHVSCTNVKPVTTDTISIEQRSSYSIDPAAQSQVYGALNDVIVAGILCDTSRIAVVNITDTFSSYSGDWHQEVAHHADFIDGQAQGTIADAHQATFEHAFLDLCAKLDVDDGSGRTYLDDTLVAWTQESGIFTHDGQGMPVITAGGAGGFLKTGNYVDYRNPAIVLDDDGDKGPSDEKVYGGLLWHQWLGTALQAMGIAKTEYETNGLGGYPGTTKFIGTFFKGESPSYFYPDAVWNAASDVLPFLKA
jgi:hypothetical protein